MSEGSELCGDSTHYTYEDTLAGVEKAVHSLPVEMAEEARQETVRIIKSSSRPRDNLTRAEREALKTLKNNTNLTILQADNGNATAVLNTVDYKQKITSLLEDPSYRNWPGTLLIRQNERPHYCLKNPLSQKMYANNCVRPDPDPQDCMDSQRYIKRGFL